MKNVKIELLKNYGGYLAPKEILNKSKCLLSAGVGNFTLFEIVLNLKK